MKDEATETDAAVSEEAVIAFLKRSPDFLLRHPHLLETLEVRHGSGPAVSLIERQVEILRGKNARLEDRLLRLVDAAQENEKRVNAANRLARALLRAPTLATVVSSLARVMRDDFGVDEVFVGVHAPTLLRQDIDGLTRLDASGQIVRHFNDFFRTKLIDCGPISEMRAKLLFPKARPLPLSAAIVPLEKERNLGMLALAARDADRFQPKQGKYFLEMTADLVAAALRARLG
ncbi:MAG: DUF484 family protein [Gammaproteobacteria bacterium]|nr:DUF484 family protein [Gammaproteobacteria bacterium]